MQILEVPESCVASELQLRTGTGYWKKNNKVGKALKFQEEHWGETSGGKRMVGNFIKVKNSLKN